MSVAHRKHTSLVACNRGWMTSAVFVSRSISDFLRVVVAT